MSSNNSNNSDRNDKERCDSSEDRISEIQERIREAEQNVEELEEKAEECEKYAKKLEEARRELEEAIAELYEAMREAERELMREAQEAISRGDYEHASKLKEELNQLRGYIKMVREIKDSFNDCFPSSFRDIIGIAGQMVSIANSVTNVAPSVTHAANTLVNVSQNIAINAVLKDPQLAGAPGFCAIFGDPINVSTGNFYYTKEDIKVPGRYPLEFKRFYNAIGGFDGVLGANWTHNYNIRLFNNEEQVHIVFDDGHVETYTRVEDGFYVAPMEHNKTLTVPDDGEGGFYLTAQTMERYRFDDSGALRYISDTNGNRTALEYEGNGILLTEVRTSSGVLSFSYDDDGRMACVSDHTGRQVSFEYDQGQLTKVVQPSGARFRYEYDASGKMSKITNPLGIESVRNTYDERGRTIVQHMADGGVA